MRDTLLAERAPAVHWVVADITQAELPSHAYDFWHDRAVFHFLRDEDQRHRYVSAVRRSVKPGGHILVATFGLEGPTRCSGLGVMRYGPEELHAEFGSGFQKVGSLTEIHSTPWGAEQQFVYCYCRLLDPNRGACPSPTAGRPSGRACSASDSLRFSRDCSPHDHSRPAG